MSYFFKDCNMLVNHSLWCHILFFQIFCISQQNSYTQFIIQKTALNISGLCHCCSWIKAHKITGHNTQLFCIFFCFYIFIQDNFNRIITSLYTIIFIVYMCSRSKFLTKLLKTFDKTFREIFPVFISTKRREKPSAFFDNNFVNNAYFSEAASSSSSHLASSSSKAPISSRMTCLCLWSS